MKKIKTFFTVKKNIYITAAVIVFVVGIIFYFRNSGTHEQVLAVHHADFLQQVSVSGKVVATSDLDLSFEQGGRVSSVQVKVGDTVKAGQLLISQDVAALAAQYREMQAGVDIQKAKQSQLIAGSSPEDIAVAETNLVTAKQKVADAIQDVYTKIDDALRNHADRLFEHNGSLYSFGIYFLSGNDTYSIHTNAEHNDLKVSIDTARNKMYTLLARWPSTSAHESDDQIEKDVAFANDSLLTMRDMLNNIQQALSYLRTTNATEDAIYGDFKAGISTARTSISTADTSLLTAITNLHSAQSELALAKAPVRPADASLYTAQVAQAEASAQNVLADLAAKQIRAPIDGIITVVNPKVGTTVAANDIAISMISTDTLEIESYVPEKNIPFVQVGDEAQVTLDAYGDDTLFSAKVISIDPAETIRDGVSTYRVKLQFAAPDDRVKSGMTANVLITTEQKSNVISVPQGIVKNVGGSKFVMVKENGKTTERTVETGSVSSLGEIEITSGLNEGDVVILQEAN